MSALAVMLESFLLEKAATSNIIFSARTKAGMGLIALSGLLAIIGAGFLSVAGYIWLQSNYPPQQAAAIAGVFMLGCAALLGLTAWLFLQYRKRRIQHIKEEIIQTLEAVFEVFEKEIEDPVRENPKTAIALSGLAGYMTGGKIL